MGINLFHFIGRKQNFFREQRENFLINNKNDKDKENSAAKEIKKAGRYPPPKQLLPVELAAIEKEKLSPSPKRKMKKKRPKKKQIEMTDEQKIWNKVFVLMEKQRVKPIKLFSYFSGVNICRALCNVILIVQLC